MEGSEGLLWMVKMSLYLLLTIGIAVFVGLIVYTIIEFINRGDNNE